MPRAAPAELIDFLAPFSDEVHELALGLRARVLTVVPNAHEFVWDATNAVSLAYTSTTRWQDSVVHIASYAKWVNLGFNEGASLDDPLGILVGTGAHIRHVRFSAIRDLDAVWLDDYLRAALDNAGCRADMGDGGTTVRMSVGPKRRPPEPPDLSGRGGRSCEPDATVGAVARQAGYASPFALSTAFKRVRGVSPRQHRVAALAK
jgi:AraC-like DNA-binding protein